MIIIYIFFQIKWQVKSFFLLIFSPQFYLLCLLVQKITTNGLHLKKNMIYLLKKHTELIMSDIINSNKFNSLIIGNDEDVDIIIQTARAFASRDRINILRLLVETPMNIYEISKKLNMPISTVSNHISVLEDAQIVYVSTQQGLKRHVKMCSNQINEITIKLYGNIITPQNDSFSCEIPVGHFTEANIAPPCGMYILNRETHFEETLSLDTPTEFFHPERFCAELIWFDHGFISYNFPNKFYKKSISKLEFFFELCSEVVYHRNDWPSDITIKINNLDALTFLSPGDYGGRRGKYSPKNWNINSTQYGQLYKITITHEGIFLNDVLMSKKNITSFLLTDSPFIKISLGVKENAVHRGGLNLFGKNFGDYNQALILTIYQ